MEQLFRKKMWNGGGKKVIDRVWRKISFDCKSNPFFKNAHSYSQKLVKSLRVNHFDSTTSRFRTFRKYLENSSWYLKRWVIVLPKVQMDRYGQLVLIVRQRFSPELSLRLMDALSKASAAFLTTALETEKLRCILAPSAITPSKGTQWWNDDRSMRISKKNKVYNFS